MTSPQTPLPPQKRPLPHFLKPRLGFKLSSNEVVACLLILNIFIMSGLYWRIETQKPPIIATVSVSQLSRLYGQQIASDPSNSPEMITLKTRIFTATTEKWLANTALQKGMVIFARECVLSGDSLDLTPQVRVKVDQALKSGTLGLEGAGNGTLNPAN